MALSAQVTVIGAGPAGLQAAMYAASEGFDTVLIERGRIGGQIVQTPKLENFIGQSEKGVSGPAFIAKARRQALALGVRFEIGDVTELKRDGNRCCVSMVRHNGRVLEIPSSKATILAVGSTWRRLDAPGAEEQLNKTFHYGPFPTMHVERGLRYVVVGGGNSAGQAIITLADHAYRVTVVARSGLNMMSQYLVDRINANPRIEVIKGETIDTVYNNGVRLSGGRRVDAEHTFFAGGTVPNTSFLPADMLDEKGFIKTGLDGAMSTQTSIPSVFAIGDARANVWRRSVANAVADANNATSEIFRYLEMVAMAGNSAAE